MYLSRRVKYGRIAKTERVVFDHVPPFARASARFTRHAACQFVYAGSQLHSPVLKGFVNRKYLFCLLNHSFSPSYTFIDPYITYLPNPYVYFSLTNPFLIENNYPLKRQLHETRRRFWPFLTMKTFCSKLYEQIMKAGFNSENKENASIKNVFVLVSNIKNHDAHLSLFATTSSDSQASHVQYH